MKNTAGWDFTPQKNIDNYLAKCKLFVNHENYFKTFRQDSDYKKILEGGEYSAGMFHLNRILELYGLDGLDFLIKNLEKFKENDIYGTPEIYEYNIVGNICPCTLLYISHSFDIAYLLGYFQPKKIVEIGGGYGGLCKTLDVIYDFDEYILIDLPEAIELCKKYLNNFPELYNKTVFITTEEFYSNDKIYDADLFIAICSLAECGEDIQNMYVDRILMNSKFGFLMYNTLHISEIIPIYEKLMTKIYGKFHITVDTRFVNLGGTEVSLKNVSI